jgi:glycosyltransferase involved in cell wall biosynthesis
VLRGLGSDASVDVVLVGMGAQNGPVKVAECECQFLSVGKALVGTRTPLRVHFVRALLANAALVRQERCDVIYAQSAESTLAAALVLPGVPVVLHCHGTENTIKRSRYWYGRTAVVRALYEIMCMRPALRIASTVLVTAGREEFEVFAAQYKLRAARCYRVPALVDTDLFRPVNTPDRACTTPEAAIRLACVARLEKPKGIQTVIRAVALMAKRGRAVTLAVIGDGGYRGELEAMAQRLELGGAIQFRGYLGRCEIASELRQSDVFVTASEQEGFSIALLEALASGVPVVTTDVGAAREVVRDGETGFVLRSCRPEEIAARVCDAFALGAQAREACRTMALEYSTDRVSLLVSDALKRAAQDASHVSGGRTSAGWSGQ